MKMSMMIAGALMAVVAGLMLGSADGCSEQTEYMARLPKHNESDTQKLHYSDVVMYGKVLSKVKGGNYMYNDREGFYAIKFEVFCVYKGASLMQKDGAKIPKITYIMGAGGNTKKDRIPGCPKVDVDEKEMLIMYLKPTPKADEFEIEYAPGRGEADLILDELSLHCNLDFVAIDETCNDFPPFEDEDCLRYEVPKRPVTEKPPMDDNKDDTMIVDVNNTPKEDDTNKDNDNNMGYDTEKNTPSDEPEKPGKSTGDGNGAATCLSSLAVLVSAMLASLV